MQRLHLIFSILLMALSPINTSIADEREADHAALREIMKISSEALNTKNLELLKPILSTQRFTITTVDGQKFDSLEAFSSYWKALFEGEEALLERIEVDPIADRKTEFLAENVGLVEGTSTETYHFTDGDVISMQTRWSAVTIREGEDWKLASIHFSANLLDNPLLDVAKQKMTQYVIAAALAGLVLGLILMGVFRGKKAAG
ncbi:MAG: nuclear transport factor 2 family protein [Gammaproteobacteria bacterium]|nr:nuclear transport factor 2 family protein [Gammaproteobacteria bacterium]MDH3447375.1 nuclear transport factor 2 family protein [Gammaproteobacteria bacterium]